MNLLFTEDLKNQDHFGVILLINAVAEKRFNGFISAMLNKQDWHEELCCCYYRSDADHDGYLLESFDNDFYMCYEELMEYVTIAIRRYLNNCNDEIRRSSIQSMLHGTAFEDLIKTAQVTDEKAIPLVYEQKKDGL